MYAVWMKLSSCNDDVIAHSSVFHVFILFLFRIVGANKTQEKKISSAAFHRKDTNYFAWTLTDCDGVVSGAGRRCQGALQSAQVSWRRSATPTEPTLASRTAMQHLPPPLPSLRPPPRTHPPPTGCPTPSPKRRSRRMSWASRAQCDSPCGAGQTRNPQCPPPPMTPARRRASVMRRRSRTPTAANSTADRRARRDVARSRRRNCDVILPPSVQRCFCPSLQNFVVQYCHCSDSFVYLFSIRLRCRLLSEIA